MCPEPAWCWGGWSHFLKISPNVFVAPPKGSFLGAVWSWLMCWCILVRSLGLRWKLRTWGTWMVGPNSSSNTTRGQTKQRLLFWQYWNICLGNVRKMYFTEIFTRTFYFLGIVGYSSFVLWRKAQSVIAFRVRIWATTSCWAAVLVVSTS